MQNSIFGKEIRMKSNVVVKSIARFYIGLNLVRSTNVLESRRGTKLVEVNGKIILDKFIELCLDHDYSFIAEHIHDCDCCSTKKLHNKYEVCYECDNVNDCEYYKDDVRLNCEIYNTTKSINGKLICFDDNDKHCKLNKNIDICKLESLKKQYKYRLEYKNDKTKLIPALNELLNELIENGITDHAFDEPIVPGMVKAIIKAVTTSSFDELIMCLDMTLYHSHAITEETCSIAPYEMMQEVLNANFEGDFDTLYKLANIERR